MPHLDRTPHGGRPPVGQVGQPRELEVVGRPRPGRRVGEVLAGGPPAAPAVSVVMPARDAADTIVRTLDSVRAQTSGDWEVVVVDDGSTDGTADLVADWAAGDPRVRVLPVAAGGVGRARNAGIAVAAGTWLLFLDADDVIEPAYVERALALLRADPALDGVRARWAYESPAGRAPMPDPLALPGATWATVVQHECPFPIHCCIVRAGAVRDAGGFDEALAVAEDWDLWLRLGRRGLRLGVVDDVMAIYVLRPGSATRRDFARVLTSSATVIRRAAVAGDEASARRMEDSLRNNLCWVVALAAGAGAGAGVAEALAAAERPSRLDVDLRELAAMIVENAPLAAGRLPAEWPELWAAVERSVQDAVAAFVEWVGLPPGSARTVLRRVERAVAMSVPGQGAVRLGGTLTTFVDLERPVEPVAVPEGVERLVARVWAGDAGVGFVEVAALGGVIPAATVELAVRHQLGPRVLRAAAGHPRLLRAVLATLGRNRPVRSVARFAFDRPAGPGPDGGTRRERLLRSLTTAARPDPPPDPSVPSPDAAAATPAAVVSDSADRPDGPVGAGGSAGGAARWERVFESPDPWTYTSAYERVKFAQTLDVVDGLPSGRVLELACAEGHFTAALAPRVGELLATDISPTALARAAERCRAFANVRFRTLDLAHDDLPPDQDLIVCCEVLYYLDAATLATVARRIAAALSVGGSLVMTHARVLADEPHVTGFDWGDGFGGVAIGRAFEAVDGLVLRREHRSDLYAIQHFERVAVPPPPPPPSAGGAPVPAPAAAPVERRHLELARPLDAYIDRMVVWGGFAVSREEARREEVGERVPVLMYHRVAETGVPSLDSMRVTPDQFEAQLRHLRRHGYHGLMLSGFGELLARRAAPSGRAVVLTFDDAYQDFADHALPLLQAYGFPATVFVVADLAGRTAEWDADLGAPPPLMDWATIRRAEAAGIEIASHSGPHRALTTLAPADALRQERAARRRFEAELGHPVSAIAYPYGDVDEPMRQTMRAAGYLLGVETRPGHATVWDDPMSIPRVEVRGQDSLDAFVAGLGVPARRNALGAAVLGGRAVARAGVRRVRGRRRAAR